MEFADNDIFVNDLKDAGYPYIEIVVRNDDGSDSPLHKTASQIALLVNALMTDFYLAKEGRPDIFLTSLDYQISNLLSLRNAYFREVLKDDIDEDDTPIPDAFKNAFD
tara:strand:- start:245 stop:568 length:324 start_codon:yes stop_codon:yes gene_type:complete